LISITDTGLGQRSVAEDIQAVSRKIEHWHEGSISSSKSCVETEKDSGTKVRLHGKNASLSPLAETDEQKARKKLLTIVP
jgi:hypothetical protein